MKVIGTKQPELRKKDDRYEVYDLELEDLTLSATYLNQGKSTTGHSHDWEEAYYIIKGKGQILVGANMKEIRAGDIIIIPGGDFHRVFNDTCPKLVFLCVFRRHYA